MSAAQSADRTDAWADAEPPSMAPPELLREPPATTRGARTRASLIAAARTVFERDGYLEARLTDITSEAGCSTGSFYTYFDNKEQVFAAVLEQAQEDMLHPGMGRIADPDDFYAVLGASNRAYLEAYRRNARLMVLMEQVANIDSRFRELRRRRGEVFIARNARAIADLQRRGVADPDLDPVLASRVLSSMVSRVAYSVIGLGDGPRVAADARAAGEALTDADFGAVVDTVTRIWANGLRLPANGG